MNKPTPRKKRANPRGFRVIMVDGARWLWRATSQSLALRGPGGRRVYLSASDAIGVSPDEYERGQWKRTGAGMVQPRDVAGVIRHIKVTPPYRAFRSRNVTAQYPQEPTT